MSPATLPSPADRSPGSSPKTQSFRGPFSIMTMLFFMWGFMTVFNDILIPRFKEAFTLNYFQAMLVQFAFFGAYAVGALAYYAISVLKGDPINRIGYKNGVTLGLLIAALGSVLFYPAALLGSYFFFLVALFIVGLGFAMLQIAANPYVTILGPEHTASSRLNLSQAFNSLGTTIGPLIGGWLIFKFFMREGAQGADSVKIPYLCFAVVFLLLAVFFRFAHLPNFTNTEGITKGAGALKHPHTVLGMVAIFMYVGGEVTVGSSIINYLNLPSIGGLNHEHASTYLAYFWGGLMIGRFMGAFVLGDLKPALKNFFVCLVPVVAFACVWALGGGQNALPYGILLAGLLGAFFVGRSSAGRMLVVFSVIIIGLLLTGMTASGNLAMWSVLGVGLFCSVMWSNIFSLAIEGLGPLKSQASSLLVMAILGGAILPPLQGAVADVFGVQFSYIIPAIAFAYIAFYGMKGHRMGRQLS